MIPAEKRFLHAGTDNWILAHSDLNTYFTSIWGENNSIHTCNFFLVLFTFQTPHLDIYRQCKFCLANVIPDCIILDIDNRDLSMLFDALSLGL